MSAYYDLYETPSPDGKEDKKSLHARICPKGTYTQKEFVEHVSTFQHLPKNVIGAALDACIDELCDLLANGNIVELGELGFFSTSLKCLRETDDEKKKIRSESVQFQNVHLRISSTFRNNIKKKMTLERVHSTTKNRKGSRDHRRNKKSRTGTVPQAECMHQQKRIHPIERADQTCRHRRTEQIHPARVPAPPRDGKVNGLCAARKRHSKRNLGGEHRGTKTQKLMLYLFEKNLCASVFSCSSPQKDNKQWKIQQKSNPPRSGSSSSMTNCY